MNQIDLKGRAAVVTGGARGIGFAISQRLLDSGASVSLWDRDEQALALAKSSLAAHGRVETEVVDVSDEASVSAAAGASKSKFGAIDILVNNAGIAGPTVKTWEYEPAAFREVLEVDLVSVFLCCRALVPSMMEKGYGRYINYEAPNPAQWSRPADVVAREGLERVQALLRQAENANRDT